MNNNRRRDFSGRDFRDYEKEEESRIDFVLRQMDCFFSTGKELDE